jgi:uncharacterized membrane protein YjdF
MTTVAMAGLWEIVEWLYAAFDGGNVGAAFLGSQGIFSAIHWAHFAHLFFL